MESLVAQMPDRQRLRQRDWRRACLAIAASIAVLLICGSYVDWSRIFVYGMDYTLTDQTGYISVGRTFADTGKLESTLIFGFTLPPGVKSYVYLPGHYLALGLVYKLFGYSVAHSFWPSLAGFLLSSVLVVMISSALFGGTRALPAWVLYVFFPLNLIYAFTAMAEMTVQASVVAAFAMFLAIPSRWRRWLGPLTLILPLLFRETGFVIVLPMAACIYRECGRRLAAVLQFGAIAVLVAVLVLSSPIAAGRAPMLAISLLGGASTAPPAQWASAIGKNIAANFELLLHPYSKPGAEPIQVIGLWFVLTGIPLALWRWRRTGEIIYPAIGLMVLALFASIVGLYTLWWYRGIRHLLMTEPFVAMLWADTVLDLPGPVFARRVAGRAVLIAAGIAGVVAMRSTFRTEAAINSMAAQNTAFFEALHPDVTGTLVSPWEFSLDYFQTHYPIRWSFLPGNDDGLRTLNSKYPIATLVLRKGSDDKSLTPGAITSIGLTEGSEAAYQGIQFTIYRRASPR